MAKKTTEIATLALTKENVPQFIENLKKKLADLKGHSKDTISLEVVYQGTTISKVTTVKELLEISASINARGKAYEERVSHFKLINSEGVSKVQPFTVSNKTVDEWDAIIEKAIYELLNKTEIQTLENAINKLSQHLDADTKLKNELETILNDAAMPIK